jgi:hypothetical protein
MRILENNQRKNPRNLKSNTMRTNHTLTDKWNPKSIYILSLAFDLFIHKKQHKSIQLKLKSRNTLVGQYHDAFKLKFRCTNLRHLMTGKVWGVLLHGQTYRFLTTMARIFNGKT